MIGLIKREASFKDSIREKADTLTEITEYLKVSLKN